MPDFKVNSLFDKIYEDFVKGKYGYARIPSHTEVMDKMKEITTTDYEPITKPYRLSDVNIEEIQTKFSNIIDDLDVLFDSIEKESLNVLDQLTYSLKEHNGVKRELRKIRTRNDDIANGKLGKEYLNYSFTESFDDLTNININRSDPVNLDAGIFTIVNNGGNILSLNHHKGHKLEFNIVENYSRVLNYGYIGSADAVAILDPSDPKQLVYKIKTASPTRLRTVLVIQLSPDEKPVDINALVIDLDSSLTKGSVRAHYRQSYKWYDVPTMSIQHINSDKVNFGFPKVSATHVKIEFIKDVPDIPDTNEYYFVINALALGKADTKGRGVLYSKPIDVQRYSRETPIVSTLSATMDADVPDSCTAQLYVAQDIKISGQFLDAIGDPVAPGSAAAVEFDPTYSGSVYLSEVFNSPDTVSGVLLYQGLDFDWKPIRINRSDDNSYPDMVEFRNTNSKPLERSSLYGVPSYYLWGDQSYQGPWPQDIATQNYFISGWCNSNNADWSYLQPLVNANHLIEGPDIASLLSIPYGSIEDAAGVLNPAIAAHPLYSGQWLGYASGYIFDHYLSAFGRTIKFGEYSRVIDGWWRPYADAVSPTGIVEEFVGVSAGANGTPQLSEEYVNTNPDFYFNGMGFYKIYKFGNISNVIQPSVKLYSYETRPLGGDDGEYKPYYAHNFIWKYQTVWENETNTITNVLDRSPTNRNVIEIELGNVNEEYIVDGILELKLNGTNTVFTPVVDYKIKSASGVITGIDLSPMLDTYPSINISGDFSTASGEPPDAFDYKYSYRKKNRYSSTWTGYAIVRSSAVEPNIKIKNHIDNDGNDIINSVVVESVDDKSMINVVQEGSNFVINFGEYPRRKGDRHYKITIYSSSDENTGFSSLIKDTYENYIPYEDENGDGNITVSPGVMVVNRLKPIQLVDFSTLIYDTPMNDDSRAALYTDWNEEKFIVVKEPSKRIFPGYHFDSINNYYIVDEDSKIKNVGHYVRYGADTNADDKVVLYTTGSQGTTIKDSSGSADKSWNRGNTLPEYPNENQSVNYPVHSTYAYPINIETVSNNAGFLFYNTAENLPAYYSIAYKLAVEGEQSNSRFLYKIELTSDDRNNLAPIVRSVQFTVNREP